MCLHLQLISWVKFQARKLCYYALLLFYKGWTYSLYPVPIAHVRFYPRKRLMFLEGKLLPFIYVVLNWHENCIFYVRLIESSHVGVTGNYGWTVLLSRNNLQDVAKTLHKWDKHRYINLNIWRALCIAFQVNIKKIIRSLWA